jgi:hypothetical protein
LALSAWDAEAVRSSEGCTAAPQAIVAARKSAIALRTSPRVMPFVVVVVFISVASSPLGPWAAFELPWLDFEPTLNNGVTLCNVSGMRPFPTFPAGFAVSHMSAGHAGVRRMVAWADD